VKPETDTAALKYAITEPGNDRWPFDQARIQLAYGSALRRVKRTTDVGLASLTPQQRQIALLAAAGHTNKEIAARLFLSPRTVSTHLYQVFPKLGITSRAALRDALADPAPE
jgi:DNA-binding CsgD family transcriptional regulator